MCGGGLMVAVLGGVMGREGGGARGVWAGGWVCVGVWGQLRCVGGLATAWVRVYGQRLEV